MTDIFFSDKGYMTKEVRGDKIQVKLMDNEYNVYYKAEAHIKNPVEMRKLGEELKLKGVSLRDTWF